MQIVTEVVSHLDGTPRETTNAMGMVAEVVVYQTPEDFLE